MTIGKKKHKFYKSARSERVRNSLITWQNKKHVQLLTHKTLSINIPLSLSVRFVVDLLLLESKDTRVLYMSSTTEEARMF